MTEMHDEEREQQIALLTDELTPRQAAFAHEYLKDFNITRAAIRAGFAKSAAAQHGHWLLKHHKVKALMALEAAQARAKHDTSRERIVQELARIGLASMESYVSIDANGEATVDLSDLDDDQWRAISEITVEDVMVRPGSKDEPPIMGKKTKVKLHSKTTALEQISKLLGYVVDRKQLEIKGVTQKRVILEHRGSLPSGAQESPESSPRELIDAEAVRETEPVEAIQEPLRERGVKWP